MQVPTKPRTEAGRMLIDLLDRWSKMAPAPSAAVGEEFEIEIFDVIGEDLFDAGFTSRDVSRALSQAGGRDIVVRINSPGGDMFEGISIYNLLKSYAGRVRVEIVGIAASAASIIAMAGDEIVMHDGTFLMIHNAWGLVVGNKHDFQRASEIFDQFDASLVEIYTSRAGGSVTRDEVIAMMDAETFLDARQAIEAGLADIVTSGQEAGPAAAMRDSVDRRTHAKRRAELAMAMAGMSRADRVRTITEISVVSDSGGSVERDADEKRIAAEQAAVLIATMLRKERHHV